jgi:UDP-N-acetylglucosamine 3-dehydrogenase
MPTINTAVIGCGSWGRNHARVYRSLPGATLTAVSDTSESIAREIGELHRVPYYTDPDKVLRDPNIQVVDICTPTVTHHDIALRAIENGKNVLVEKPMTNTIDEAQNLIRAARKAGVALTVGFVERFNPAVQEVYKRIASGEIGDVILAHTRRVSRSPQRIGDVGVVKDLAIHDLDIINHLLGEDPLYVSAVTGSIRHKYEDYANINLLYSRDRNAFVETNWLTPRRVRTLTVTGTEGIINVEYTTQQLTIENNEMIIQPFLQYKEPLYEELHSFIDHVARGVTPEITGEDGLKALELCEAALKSSATKRMIRINDEHGRRIP